MAVQSMRDIERRISSVKSTQQITRAMEMVAAAKLRRAQQRANSSSAYSDGLRRMLAQLVANEAPRYGASSLAQLHPLLAYGQGGRKCFVIVTADRGLAGGFNANINRYAEQQMAENPDAGLMVIGRKGKEYFAHRKVEIVDEWLQIGDDPQVILAREISRRLVQGYMDAEFNEIHLVYTRAKSAISQEVVDEQLLPIDVDSVKVEDGEAGLLPEYIYEPSAGDVFESIFPRYVENLLFRALIESKASEHGARMTAMRSATDNAQEMINELTLSFNRARQAGITTELSEIVGGAEALSS